MSFSNRILVGLGTGVLLGLFLGERAVAFNTATGLRTPMPGATRLVDPAKPIDFTEL